MSKTNVFTDSQRHVNTPNRNTFDLSFQNNLTMDFGKLYPVFCKEVIPGDSFHIDPTFGLKFAPMVFPTQTRMTARLHFFYVRNRNLWKDWPDFIGKNKDNLTMPYISQPASSPVWSTGGLGDYLGVPTVVQAGNTDTRELKFGSEYYKVSYRDGRETYSGSIGPNEITYTTTTTPAANSAFGVNMRGYSQSPHTRAARVISFTQPLTGTSIVMLNSTTTAVTNGVRVDIYADKTLVSSKSYNVTNTGIFSLSADDLQDISLGLSATGHAAMVISSSNATINSWLANVNNTSVAGTIRIVEDKDIFDKSQNPFSSDSTMTNKATISALPFRAYESVYNAFYRNAQNDPFKINGVNEYNKYIPTNEGGADHTDYHLYNSNWEMDAFTSALPSPQQGAAPLVGVSTTGDFTFQVTDVDAGHRDSAPTFTVKTVLKDDGTLTGISGYQAEEGIDRSIVDSSIRRLNQTIMQGISINDFRNVNSFQRWLETNMRRGFKYRDQLMSHFGVEAKYEELDMPEFIGGHTESVIVNQVNANTEGNGDQVIGSFAGQANCFGSGRTISQYCDEHGFIIGIMSVVPTPNYSQNMPKHMYKTQALDYYFPEFAHIGYQPITNKELAPLQCSATQGNRLDDTFGYQRYGYDYLASTDEIHGQMRTNMKNFVITRTFDGMPKLGHDFIVMDDKDVNSVFANTSDDEDKIMGQIYFDVKAKRPISRFGVPRLE